MNRGCSVENEAKLLLWWHKILESLSRQLHFGTQQLVVCRLLQQFIASLSPLAEDKASGGLLAAIGLGRKSQLSLRYWNEAWWLHRQVYCKPQIWALEGKKWMAVHDCGRGRTRGKVFNFRRWTVWIDDVRRWTEGGLPAARRISLDRLWQMRTEFF